MTHTSFNWFFWYLPSYLKLLSYIWLFTFRNHLLHWDDLYLELNFLLSQKVKNNKNAYFIVKNIFVVLFIILKIWTHTHLHIPLRTLIPDHFMLTFGLLINSFQRSWSKIHGSEIIVSSHMSISNWIFIKSHSATLHYFSRVSVLVPGRKIYTWKIIPCNSRVTLYWLWTWKFSMLLHRPLCNLNATKCI